MNWSLRFLGVGSSAAVELGSMALGADFDAEEPSDEVLMQLENEESILLNLSFDDDTLLEERKLASTESESTDYTTMTVAQLREELQKRGLRVSSQYSFHVSFFDTNFPSATLPSNMTSFVELLLFFDFSPKKSTSSKRGYLKRIGNGTTRNMYQT